MAIGVYTSVVNNSLCIFVLLFSMSVIRAADPPVAANVIIVTIDGFRWQELFNGCDLVFMDSKVGGVKDEPGLKKRYHRDGIADRRKALMPFFWETVVAKGQLFGNPAKQCSATLTNGLKFSYPGYSEMFCGFADPTIDSNAKKPNPNLSVLEFLNTRPGFENKVEAICAWDVFPSIFRSKQNGLRVHAGWTPLTDGPLTDRERTMNQLMAVAPRVWPQEAFDGFVYGAVQSAIERRKPRVLMIGLGETDEWAHARRYDLYLDAAAHADQFLAELWASLQKNPHYQDSTTLIITTDHGRGSTRIDWTDHGKNVDGAEMVWMAILGPGVPATGERESLSVTLSQIARTIANAVGEDFSTVSPKSAPMLKITK
jgi:hypothetical protein